jgi:hypothetical protein
MLGNPDLVNGVLEVFGMTPTKDEKVNRALAAFIFLAENPGQATDAVKDMNLLPQQEKLVEAKIKAAEAQAEASKALAGKRESETEKLGAEVGFGFEGKITISDPIFGDKLEIPRSLYVELAPEPIAQWTPEQRTAAINKLVKEDGYSIKEANAILDYMIEQQAGE